MPRTPASAGARHPALTWTLRVLRAAQLALLLCFVAYFASVQVNAVAYLAGRNGPVVRGADPPLPLTSGLAAVADIMAGLVVEAIAALVVFIAVSVIRGVLRNR
jgi:hypothetical protein